MTKKEEILWKVVEGPTNLSLSELGIPTDQQECTCAQVFMPLDTLDSAHPVIFMNSESGKQSSPEHRLTVG